MTLASENRFPLVRLLEAAEDPDPTPAGEVHLRVNSSGLFYTVDDAGVVRYPTIGGYTPGGTDVAVADGGTGASSAAAARTNLGLVIGTDVQAFDADIATVAASQAEAEAGTEAALRSFSPLRVAQAIAALGGGGGGAFPEGLGAGEPGAPEWNLDGTADTLPTDWAWVGAAPASWHLNSAYPGLFLWERPAGNTTEYKLRISNFTMAATSGLWVRMGCGVPNGASSQWEWIIYDSTSANGYGAGIHNGNVWVARDVASSVLSNRGTYTGIRGKGSYIGVMRVSNTWATYFSEDGISWAMIQSPDTRSFTVDRLEFRWSSDAGGFSSTWLSRAWLDWIEYRADNLFPRP